VAFRIGVGHLTSRLGILLLLISFCVTCAAAQEKIDITFARIGCLDIQKDGNLTELVGQACNGRTSCSYKAPTPAQYQHAGVKASTRTFCTQAMEIIYTCGHNDPHNIMVPGDAWTKAPAELVCNPTPPQNTPLSLGAAPINVVKARIGCLDIQKDGNLTNLVARDCNGRLTCSFEAPTPDQYAREGVKAATRFMCTQGMEIIYRCGQYNDQIATVAGDAWLRPPAYLDCEPSSEGANIVNSKRLDASTVLWRIDEPTVNQPTTSYPQIQFHPSDEIEITAGGCVQTSHHDNSWKSYTQPLGQNAANLYSGTIMIPTVIPPGANGFQRIGGWIGKSLSIPTTLPPTIHPADLYLRLGYQDDVYRDNGYANHDNGDPPQCAGIGNAWVEVKIISPTGGTVSGALYSPHEKPFDLVWDMKAGVDANGLPLNPIWAFQIGKPPEQLPDFKGFCGSSFPDHERRLNVSTLAGQCTSQSPTVDFPDTDIPCGLSPEKVMVGHLNWGIATEVGTAFWSEDSNDGDFNFELTRVDNAAQTTLNTGQEFGLHMEFNEGETINNFKAPFWRTFQDNIESLSSSNNNAAYAAVNGKPAIVTGLIGIDGVHGGYTESHPVFSLAIQTQEQSSAGGVDESWAFFLRNNGGEGCCSNMNHYWYGLTDPSAAGVWYFIQLPAPAGATDASVVTSSSQVWTNHPGVTGPVITKDSQWTYIGFQLPSPESGPELDGQISLHYTVPSGAAPLPPKPAPAAPFLRKADVRGGEDWEDARKLITNAADLKTFDDALRAQRLAAVKPKPHTLQLHVAATIPPHRPLVLTTPGHKGILTRARAVQEPAVVSARNALTQKMLRVIPKAALPPNVNPKLLSPR
jgi:hypothetical protein